jgi:hypothetical protein
MFEGFTRRRIGTSQSTTINVMVGGSGSGLLLLHGCPQTLAMWHEIAPGLARTLRSSPATCAATVTAPSLTARPITPTFAPAYCEWFFFTQGYDFPETLLAAAPESLLRYELGHCSTAA